MKITTTKQLDALEYWDHVNTLHGADAYAICSSLQRLFNFLKTELQLNYFIPAKKVNGKWVVLEKPKKPLSPATDQQWDKWTKEREEYQKAEKEVLFKGNWQFLDSIYEHNKKVFSLDCYLEIDLYNTTIQDLIPLDLELTQNAIDKL